MSGGMSGGPGRLPDPETDPGTIHKANLRKKRPFMPAWPATRLASVKHVGTLDPTQKRDGSNEGAGLSVSLNPEAWMQIARGQVAGDVWGGRRQDGSCGSFLDVIGLKPSHLRSIRDWAVESRLAVRQDLFGFSYYDDEMEQRVSMLFASATERDRECADMDDTTLYEQNGLVATDALRSLTRNPCPPVLVEDMIITAYVESQTDHDGCWWHEILDVSILSAPRGVIVPSRISRWSFEKVGTFD